MTSTMQVLTVPDYMSIGRSEELASWLASPGIGWQGDGPSQPALYKVEIHYIMQTLRWLAGRDQASA